MFTLNEDTGEWMPDDTDNNATGDVSVSPSGNTGTTGNDVWSTIFNKGANIFRDVAVAAAGAPRVVTASAPQGAPTNRSWNPFPGLFGAFPQAEGKGGSPSPARFQLTPGLIFLVVAAIVAVFLMRRG